MLTLTMSGKGQLTVPRALREKLQLRPGCKVDVRVDDPGHHNNSQMEPIVSEIHFFMQARFPSADLSGRFFRAVYSRGAEGETTGAVEELQAAGVAMAEILDPELLWEIEDCGVDERECLNLKASCSGESSHVIGALCVAARRSGASSVLSILYDTSTGAYQALGASKEKPVELYTTYDDEAVGDDFVAGVRRLLAIAHQHTKQLVEDALLPPEAG